MRLKLLPYTNYNDKWQTEIDTEAKETYIGNLIL